MFKSMLTAYLRPAVDGWGIGLNTAADTYIVAKFHVTEVRTLPREQIVQTVRDARASPNMTTWGQVRDALRAAIAENSITETRGLIMIDKETYTLTGIKRTEATFSADIRYKPNYGDCINRSVSAIDCEAAAWKLGDIILTRKAAEVSGTTQRVWAGALNFNESSYTFVALVNPVVPATGGAAGAEPL